MEQESKIKTAALDQIANIEAAKVAAMEQEAKLKAAALELEAKIEAAKAAATEQEAKLEAATLEWEATFKAAKAAALEQEAKLKALSLEVTALEQEAKIKAEKEEIAIQIALAAADTRLKVLHFHEESDVSQIDDKGVVSHERQPNVENELNNPGGVVTLITIQNKDTKTQNNASTEETNCSATDEAGNHGTSPTRNVEMI